MRHGQGATVHGSVAPHPVPYCISPLRRNPEETGGLVLAWVFQPGSGGRSLPMATRISIAFAFAVLGVAVPGCSSFSSSSDTPPPPLPSPPPPAAVDAGPTEADVQRPVAGDLNDGCAPDGTSGHQTKKCK